MARTTNKAEDLITFSRASTGTALTKVAYGPELVTNGTFDTDSDWILSAGMTIAGGVCTFENVSTGVQCYQIYDLPAGTYEFKYDVVSITQGAIVPIFHGATGGVGSGTTVAGSFTEIITISTAASRIAFRSSTTTSAVVDNISVKEVFYNDPAGTLKLISHPTNKPRVEYDANGVAKGLLIEEARTNSLPYSNDFTQWSSSGWTTVTPNAGVSPDGTQNAALLTSGSGDGYVYRSISLTAGQTWTFSVWLKSDSPASFDVDIQIYVGSDSGNAKTVTVTNEWQRFYLTKTVTQTTNYLFLIGGVVGGTATFRDESLYAYGAQAELGSFPTSYIPTSGATATRSADIASVSVSEFGYNQAQGTLLMEFDTFSDGLSQQQYVLVGGHDTRFLYSNPGSLDWYSYDGATASTYTSLTPFNFDDTPVKAGYTEGGGSTAIYHDGNIGTAIQHQTIFDNSITNFYIGQWNGSYHLNGHIKSINYYPLRLSDAKLQELTS